MNRPKRQRKADRLVSPGATRQQIECDFVIGPFDNAAREMDRKWGVDRLPEIVGQTTARKYGAALAHLGEMIEAEDVAGCEAAAQNCIRGLQAMDREAEAAGQPKASPECLQYDLDGFRFGILPDDAHWPAVQERHPDLALFSLRQVANALMAHAEDLPISREIQKHFPGTKVTGCKPLNSNFWKSGGDPIPF